MITVSIEQGIPIPPPSCRVMRQTKYPWQTLRKGESFLVTNIMGNRDQQYVSATMRGQFCNWNRRFKTAAKPGEKPTQFRGAYVEDKTDLEKTGFRVWRVE